MSTLPRLLLSPLQIHLLGVAALSLVGTAGYYLAIEPALDERDAAMRHSADLASADRDAVVAEANIRAQRRELQHRKARLESLAIRLEPVSRTNDRMVRLTQLAETSGLSVSSIQPDTPRAEAKHTLVPIRLAGRGDFRAMQKFLGALKSQFPDTRIDTLQIDAGIVPGDAASENRGPFALDCTWYAASSTFDASPRTSADQVP